jgi:hypothetical protein
MGWGMTTTQTRTKQTASGTRPRRPHPLLRREVETDGVTTRVVIERRCGRCHQTVMGLWPERIARCTCGAWVWLRPSIRFGGSSVRRIQSVAAAREELGGEVITVRFGT